jgi:hypothetical protein
MNDPSSRLRQKALGIASLALAIGVIAVGCGGDDDGRHDAISKRELLAKGNQICRRGNAEIEAAFGRLKGPPTRARIEAVLTKTVAPSISASSTSGALGAPDGDGQRVNDILDDAQKVLDGLKADPSAEVTAAEGNGPDPFVDIGRRLHAYGLTECASD